MTGKRGEVSFLISLNLDLQQKAGWCIQISWKVTWMTSITKGIAGTAFNIITACIIFEAQERWLAAIPKIKLPSKKSRDARTSVVNFARKKDSPLHDSTVGSWKATLRSIEMDGWSMKHFKIFTAVTACSSVVEVAKEGRSFFPAKDTTPTWDASLYEKCISKFLFCPSPILKMGKPQQSI